MVLIFWGFSASGTYVISLFSHEGHKVGVQWMTFREIAVENNKEYNYSSMI